ncbi:MAG: TssN family type VI secretion system protein [Bacteroidota bacterium]
MTTLIKKPRIPFLRHPTVQQVIRYAVLWVVVFVLLAFADRLLKDTAAQVHLMGLMILVILLGVLNWWLLHKKMLVEESEGVKSFVTILTTLVGVLLFFLFSKGQEDFTYYSNLYLPAFSLFALPWFFMLAYQAHLKVPAWRYSPIEVESLGEWVGKISFAADQSRGIRWIFGDDFHQHDASGMYSFRTLTPLNVKDYKVEDLFGGLLAFHNYNMRPQEPIKFENAQWQFHQYSPWFFPKGRRMMNPKWTLAQNGLYFKRLSAKEHLEMQNIRDDLPKDFKYTTIYVRRISPKT